MDFTMNPFAKSLEVDQFSQLSAFDSCRLPKLAGLRITSNKPSVDFDVSMDTDETVSTSTAYGAPCSTATASPSSSQPSTRGPADLGAAVDGLMFNTVANGGLWAEPSSSSAATTFGEAEGDDCFKGFWSPLLAQTSGWKRTTHMETDAGASPASASHAKRLRR